LSCDSHVRVNGLVEGLGDPRQIAHLAAQEFPQKLLFLRRARDVLLPLSRLASSASIEVIELLTP
jgi:hypothetical protein